MNILAKMQQKQEAFDKYQDLIKVRQESIATLNKEIEQITDELKRLQGEYRMLVELGQEAGLLDENGNPKDQEPVNAEAMTPAEPPTVEAELVRVK